MRNLAIPTIKDLDMVFSCLKADKKLLAIAKEEKFYNGDTKFNTMFSNLFFSGGKINLKKDVDKEYQNKCLRYLKAFMGSLEPKHEEKEAICALLLSEISE